jgi:hypothetical protein
MQGDAGEIKNHARVMGMKEDNVRNTGFTRLAIFRPGIIVGNAHTPAWVGWLEASCLGGLAILISEFSVAQSPQR